MLFGLLNSDNAKAGYIASDLILTGDDRGTYKVWIPGKDWTPEQNSFSGFAANLGNLTLGDLITAGKSAGNYYPLFPLQSGGAMPYDKETGIMSTDEANPEINWETTAKTSTSDGTIYTSKIYHHSGSGNKFKFRQSEGPNSLTQTYVLGGRTGINVNIRDNAPRGNMAKLSIGTRVVVIDKFIIGMLPATQDLWATQLAPLTSTI